MVTLTILESCAHCGKQLTTIYRLHSDGRVLLNFAQPYRGGSCDRCMVLFVNPLRVQDGLDPLPVPELTDRMETRTVDWSNGP